MSTDDRLGAHPLRGGGVRFSLWAPRPRRVALRLVSGPGSGGADLPMERGPDAVWRATVRAASAGTRYLYVLDGERARPDPRARFLPEGVHGPAEVVDPAFAWEHAPPPVVPEEMIIYELHVGTFTPEGTFAAAAARLEHLARLGVTAVELMPVAAFSGARNWGYDGVALYAPAAAYGRPDDLRRLVDRAHGLGLAVLLDVVYNHLGPEGNYLGELGPYFTHDVQTAWGDAPDFRRPEVRALVVDNAVEWLRDYHLDGLRLDAIHAITDPSKTHILAELTRRARPGFLVAETDLNDTQIFDAWGFDAAWSDDFHHALHARLTGERQGYYADFGHSAELARSIQDGWVRGPHPTRSRELPAARLVVSTQTHDQVGNRARGERLEHLAGPQAARLAAVAMLAAAPAIPMLFMGEEWGARAPFQYFTSHGDPRLAVAVADGRRAEFAKFAWQGEVPDPQDEATYLRSKLDWSELDRPEHAARLRLHADLIRLRRAEPYLGARAKAEAAARAGGPVLWVERGPSLMVVLNVDDESAVAVPADWTLVLHSEDARYGGALAAPGHELPPLSAAIYRRT